jgi:aryl-alcohol dehydrogenase-like predicted oxidoreductase
MSRVGFGTSQIANTDHKYDGAKYVPLNEAKEILRRAVDFGINFFDTSPTYGNAESITGELKSAYKEKVIVATKAGLRPDGVRDFSVSFLNKEIDGSLKRLGVDCLDVFQLTKPSEKDLADGKLFSFLSELKSRGKCKYTGAIIGDIKTGYQCIESGEVDCMQVLYHLLYQDTEKLIADAGQKGLNIIIRSPLCSGLLTGDYTAHTKFSPVDGRSKFFTGQDFIKRLEILDKIQKDLNISNKELLSFSLRFILSNPNVSLIIPAASKVRQLKKLAEADKNFHPFSSIELKNIREIVRQHLESGDISIQG